MSFIYTFYFRYDVSGYPTLKWFGDDKSAPEAYNGGRTLEDLVSFVNDNAGTKRTTSGSLDESVGYYFTIFCFFEFTNSILGWIT